MKPSAVVLVGFWLALMGSAAAMAAGLTGGLEMRPSERPLALPEYADTSEEDDFRLPATPDLPPPRAPGLPVFILQGVHFEGNQALSDAQLLQAAAPWLNKPVSLADLESLRLALTQRYFTAGYMSSLALLPQQHITDGTVIYRLIEGVLSEVRVSGNGDLRAEYVRQRLLLDLGKPLRRERLQERFQLLLADPMIERLDGVLRPGAWPGESTLDLRVSRSKPYGASVAFDNHRPPSTGAETARLGAWAKNLTGHGDIAAVEFDLSEGAEEFKGGFFLPLDAHDTRIGASYQAANATVVEESLEALDIESDFSSLDLHLNRPFIKTLSRRFSLGLQFSWRESQTFLLHQPMSFSAGVGSDGKAKVSVLRLIQEYSERRPDWVLSARSTFSLGLEAFDATINEGLPDGRFLSWIGQLQMAHRLADRGTQLIMRADLQLADSALLPLERFALGGARTLRGYRENQWVRDEGFAAGLELRYPVLGDPRMEQNQSLQLAPFLDVGSAWNRAQRSQADVYSSLGLGVLWAWRNLQAALYWAAPLKSVASYPDRDLQDAGFSFRFAAQFD